MEKEKLMCTEEEASWQEVEVVDGKDMRIQEEQETEELPRATREPCPTQSRSSPDGRLNRSAPSPEIQECPSQAQAGPFLCQADPSHIQADTCPTQTGPFYTTSGTSHSRAGPFLTRAGPSHAQEGQCVPHADRLYTQAVPSHTRIRPPLTLVGPFPIQREPFPTQLDSFPNQTKQCVTHAGPSHTQNSFQINPQTSTVKCKHCKKAFSSNYALRRHIHTHHEESPTSIECDHCGQHFLRKDVLLEHIKVKHSDFRPEYRCPKCCKTFSTRHNRSHHRLNNCPSLSEKVSLRHKDDDSADMDVNERTLEAGAQTQPAVVESGPSTAPSEQPSNLANRNMLHTCPKCGRSYTWKSSLTRHLKYECGVAPQFRCPKCCYETHFKSSLKQHIIRYHGHEYTQ